MLKAVIFDMDGVIIDSEPMYTRAAILALEKHNIKVDMEYLQKFVGSTTIYMCQKLVEDFSLPITPDELVKYNDEIKDKILMEEGHIPISFITELLRSLYDNNIRLIIASSSPSKDIEEVMDTLKIRQYFVGHVSGTMVAHPKPAPDIFLEAANRLGLEPSECLVIEDSFHGVTAAKAAGMTCIGFINPNSGMQDLSKADMLVEGFDEIDFTFINKVYQRAHGYPETILETEHFIIRELTIDDMDDLYPIMQTPQIKPYLEQIPENLDTFKEQHGAYIKNVYHFYGFGLWGVFTKEDHRLAGRCGIEYKTIDSDECHEIGYLLDTPYQGQGYAQEILAAVISYAFAKLDVHRIVALIHPDNQRSINLALKVGMRKCGICYRNGCLYEKYDISTS